MSAAAQDRNVRFRQGAAEHGWHAGVAAKAHEREKPVVIKKILTHLDKKDASAEASWAPPLTGLFD